MPTLERLRVHAICHSLFPPTTLKAAVRRLGFVQADPIRSPARAQDLILRHRVKGYRAGDLEKQVIDGMTYLWPHSHSGINHQEAPRRVRFLAPFDPLVWDRRRFEHFWGWRYRFEAYTPPAKRLHGYYAMPLLWRDAVIGWVNARVDGELLNVEVGFVEKQRPRDADFQSELDAEIRRLEVFLGTTALKCDQIH